MDIVEKKASRYYHQWLAGRAGLGAFPRHFDSSRRRISGIFFLESICFPLPVPVGYSIKSNITLYEPFYI